MWDDLGPGHAQKSSMPVARGEFQPILIRAAIQNTSHPNTSHPNAAVILVLLFLKSGLDKITILEEGSGAKYLFLACLAPKN